MPIADIRSFDDFVGAGEERRWYDKAERLRGLEIDEKFKPAGLLYGQIGGLRALQEFDAHGLQRHNVST